MTRVGAWVRALTAGRRRVVAHAPRPSMVLALRPAAAPTTASVFNAFSTVRQHRELHRHEHRHLTLVRPAQVVTAATSAAPPAAVVTRTTQPGPTSIDPRSPSMKISVSGKHSRSSGVPA